MNKNLIKRGCTLAAMLALAGCGDSSSNLYTSVTRTQAAATEALCECFDALGFATAVECGQEYSSGHTPAQAACLEMAYETHQEELQPSVDCELRALSATEGCINAVAACDEIALQACLDSFDASTDACPETPQAAQAAVVACFQ